MRRSVTVAITAGLVLVAKVAEAHTFGASGAGLTDGLAHPLSGLDHILAMIAVGLWAAQLGGRAVWRVPATFVAVMALGALAGMSGLMVPLVELGVVGSLVVLGSLVASSARMPLGFGAALVGLFAFFHGHAHGTELPQAASALLYGLGFVLSTTLLHAAGVSLGSAGRQGLPARLVRVGGATIATVGLYLMAVL